MRSVARRPAALSIVLLMVVFATSAALSLLAAAPASAAPTPLPAQVVVAHSNAIDSLNGLSIAGDGSGGIVFLETIGGVPHVYVSRLEQGAWQPAQQVDTGLGAASSQPQIAAHDHGELVVAFVNSGALYVTMVRGPRRAFSAPLQLAVGAANPSVSINRYGVGYLAYTAVDGTGYDVDVDYFGGKAWHPASPHDVNVTAADNAGTGAGVPDVVAAGDGVGIVTWGESGHIYSRRIWGTATSVQTQQLDPPTVAGGWTEVTAGSPRISVGGDSSFPVVAFGEEVTSAGRVQSRVLATRLVAETAWSPIAVDDLAIGSGDATQPQVAFNESGAGFVAAAGAGNQLIATPVAADGYLETPAPLEPGGGAALPYAVPAGAGRGAVIAWQQTPTPGSSQVLVSWAPNGAHGGAPRAPTVVSAAANGRTDAALGLLAAGDDNGDAAVAWVQGAAGALSIDAAELVANPGSTGDIQPVLYSRSDTPTLRWPAALESWGGLSYTITVDGAVVGKTPQLSWHLRQRLRDGPHVWWLTATNEVSKSSTGTPQTLFVDTHPPVLHARLSGRLKASRTLRLTLRYADLPNPRQRGSRSSGVAGASVSWGGRAVRVGRASGSPVKRRVYRRHVYYTVTVTHVYVRGGHHTVTAKVIDRAGNATTVTRKLVIQPGPRGRSKSHHKRRH